VSASRTASSSQLRGAETTIAVCNETKTPLSRTAAFAARDGWLILGTREDLVAGVLDRFAGTASQNLAAEGWFADAVKQAAGERGDLRMVLNLDKLVRTPYFRSYWIQGNITEMKQYLSAVSDLYRSSQSYREERCWCAAPDRLRPFREMSGPSAALAPEDAAFYAAQASPDPKALLQSLRDNLLEMRPEQQATRYTYAPAAAQAENAGSAAQLDIPIDKAPVAVKQVDAFEPLRALLLAQQPDAVLEVYSTRAPKDGVFVSLQTAMVVSAPRNWMRMRCVRRSRRRSFRASLPESSAHNGRSEPARKTRRRSRRLPCAGWRRASLRRGERQATAAGQRFHPA